jgi:HEAT repeat protein
VERKGNGAKEAVVAALHDSDSQVRSRALYAAFKTGVDLPPTVLGGMMNDTSPDVRFLALEALSKSGDARSVAESALKDPNESVRNAAREIIATLDEEALKSQSARQAVPTDQQQQQGDGTR